MTKSMFRVLGVVASMAVGGAAVAADAPAVEWKVSDGGNGHWYALVVYENNIKWDYANNQALLKGGNLASISNIDENNFIWAVACANNYIGWIGNTSNHYGPWIGGFQEPLAANFHEPDGGWCWSDGTPWSFTAWHSLEPNGQLDVDALHLKQFGGTNGWNDTPPWDTNAAKSSVVEYSADCNGDGVVDYGQIQSGELADTNNNGVPDVCELVITSVQPISGPSTGGTAVRINGNNFPNPPVVTIGGVAATDIVRVTPSLITAVTPAGTPGMTVVAVNSASSESFYYRPSCDGDLDNNGTIDSSDLGLMLVNFGNCYESAVPEPQQQEPFILQSVETPSPLLLNKK